MPLPNRCQCYADANAIRSRDHWDYKSFHISWGNGKSYVKGVEIGEGSYGNVYSVTHVESNVKYAMKVMKMDNKNSLKKEVKIMTNLRLGRNIIQLHDVVRESGSQFPAIIMEYVDNTESILWNANLSLADVKFYMYELLSALDYTHSQGIMHRDVKPSNIVIDHDLRKLKLVDWGKSEFYHPGSKYKLNIGSRYYRAPEILLGYNMFDYSVDLWSAGCILAGLIFRRMHFFSGMIDDLLSITDTLGTEDLNLYVAKFDINLNPREASRPITPKRSWESFENTRNAHLITPDAIDLINGILRFDHSTRLTARDAMNHRFFRSIRKETSNNPIKCPSTSSSIQ